jgi:hypothetical protein
MTIPSPDPGSDGEEPVVFVPLPGSAEQGLFVTLPAERLSLAGFAQNGEADTMAPGALLSVIVNTVTGDDGAGLKSCSDDQLVGVISAARRLESRAAWTLMVALAEFASRRPARRGPAGGTSAEFAADELAPELNLTPFSAAAQIEFATTVSSGSPRPWPRWARAGSAPSTSGSSMRKPRSSGRRIWPAPMSCWPSKRRT